MWTFVFIQGEVVLDHNKELTISNSGCKVWRSQMSLPSVHDMKRLKKLNIINLYLTPQGTKATGQSITLKFEKRGSNQAIDSNYPPEAQVSESKNWWAEFLKVMWWLQTARMTSTANIQSCDSATYILMVTSCLIRLKAHSVGRN